MSSEQRYVVPSDVLATSRRMLREPGRLGLEAVVLWVGFIAEPHVCQVAAAVMPGQAAYRDGAGCAVEVPPDALSDLISWLPDGIFVMCRLHTHPGAAYHSAVDDTNMLISHNGAISIVVPDFAREPIVLSRCSINELIHGQGWFELSPQDVEARFTIA